MFIALCAVSPAAKSSINTRTPSPGKDSSYPSCVRNSIQTNSSSAIWIRIRSPPATLDSSGIDGPMHGPWELSGLSNTISRVGPWPMAFIVGPVGRDGVSPPPFQFPLAMMSHTPIPFHEPVYPESWTG